MNLPSRLGWGVAFALVTVLAACGAETTPEPAPLVIPEWSPDIPACDPGDEAFVRRVVPLLWGRHPASIREVELLVEVARASDRETLLRGMMDAPEFIERMARYMRGMMGSRNEESDVCGGPALFPYPIAALAEHIRDNPPDGPPFGYPWNTSDLVRSALLLDDLSPWFLATPFNFLASTVVDADNLEEERATRTTLTDYFESLFLNRRMACLGCHNSQYSVTGSPDPALDRTWEIPGHFEAALYGSSDGRAFSQLSVFLRIMGAVSLETVPPGVQGPPWWQFGPGVSVWGMSDACGRFVPRDEVQPDPLGFEGYLAGPVGVRASVWDLEVKMRRGFQKLRVHGRAVNSDTLEVDGELALAYLTSARFAEAMWDYVNGRRLTTPNGFPRNKAQRDVLESLTQTFVASGFSVRELLIAVLSHPWSNVAAPQDCDGSPYFMPAVFDPWVKDDADPERRGNNVGDTLVRYSPWIIVRSATVALGWPEVNEFSTANAGTYTDVDAEGLFLREIGVIVTALRGFRDSTFAERLAYEEAFGACSDPKPVWDSIDSGEPPPAPAPDWIDALIAAAGPQNTLEDAVVALKDRLLTDPALSDADERELMESLMELPLSTPVTADSAPALRRVCAALLLSPQFMMSGLPLTARTGAPVKLVVPGSERSTLCKTLAAALFGGTRLRCAGDALVFDEPAE